MDFTTLITRNQLERIARRAGYKYAHRMTYQDLERIADEAQARQRALWERAKKLRGRPLYPTKD